MDPDKIKVDVTFSFYISRAYSNAQRFNVDHIPNVVKTFETNKRFYKQPDFFQMLRSYNVTNILYSQEAYQEIIKEGIIVSMKYKYFYETINDKGEIINQNAIEPWNGYEELNQIAPNIVNGRVKFTMVTACSIHDDPDKQQKSDRRPHKRHSSSRKRSRSPKQR